MNRFMLCDRANAAGIRTAYEWEGAKRVGYLLVMSVRTAFRPLPYSSKTSVCNIWLAIGEGRLASYGLCVPQAGVEPFPFFGHSNPATCGRTSITCSHSLPWSQYYCKQNQGWLRISGRPLATFGPWVGPHLESIALRREKEQYLDKFKSVLHRL